MVQKLYQLAFHEFLEGMLLVLAFSTLDEVEALHGLFLDIDAEALGVASSCAYSTGFDAKKFLMGRTTSV